MLYFCALPIVRYAMNQLSLMLLHMCSYKHLVTKNVDQVPLQEHFRRCLQPNKTVDHQALDLLSQMLSLDPAKRPSATKCLQHPYFTDPQGEKPMTQAEFVELTQGMQSCHEFSIKQRAGKRGRRDDETAGLLTAFSLCLDMSPAFLSCKLDKFRWNSADALFPPGCAAVTVIKL